MRVRVLPEPERPPWAGGCPPGLRKPKPFHHPTSLVSKILKAALSDVADNDDERLSVYFVRTGRFVKIGYAKDLNTRLSGFRMHTPFDIELLCCIQGGIGAERAIHSALTHLHHRGEWYRLTPALRRALEVISNG